MPQSIKSEQFPEWGTITFGDMFEEIKQKTSDTEKYPLYSLTIENGVTEKTERYERSFLVTKNEDNYKIVPPNAFVYNPMNLRFGALAVNHTGKAVSVSQYYNVFKMKDESVLPFWENYLVMPSMLRFYFSIATGSLLEKLRVHYSDFVKVKKTLPSIEEQRKISGFLSLYDKRITVQATKVEALETRRKGLLQQIFSQEIRFKADDGSEFPEWDSVIIEDAFDSISDKNHPDKTVLTIIQGQGTIPRNESDRNISYNKASIPTYKLVKENDFIMHLRSFEGGLEIATREGIVSPAYTILRSKVELVPEFYRYYFRSSSFIVEKLTGITEGIRDGRSINMDDFWLLEIPYPSIPEQRKIGRFMDLINRQIQIEKDKLEAIKLVKKGLLQQMFV